MDRIKSAPKKVWSYEKARFIIVGTSNTALDFAILIGLTLLFALPAVLANIFSTSVALIVSYILNKRAVFGNRDTDNVKKFIIFLATTLFGLWVIQGGVIHFTQDIISSQTHLQAVYVVVIAKAVATVFSTVWNYLWYSRVVFNNKEGAINAK